MNDFPSATGDLLITDRRIGFRPVRGGILSGVSIVHELPTSDISGFGINGPRKRLEVRSPALTMRFLGDAVPAVYGALQVLTEVAANPAGPADFTIALAPAALCRGPVTHPGSLVYTPAQLTFVATGFLETFVGAHPLTEIPIGDIRTITLTGKLTPRLEVATATARVVFACSDVSGEYERAVSWLAANLPGPVLANAAEFTPALAAEIDAVLASSRGVGALAETPIMFTPAVGLSANSPATPGWLFIGAESMVWLPGPSASAGARPPVSLPLGRERWIWNEAKSDISADREGIPYRWVTKLGAPFRAALFEQVERIRKRIALAWASSGTGVVADGQNRRDSYRVQVMEQGQPNISIWLAGESVFRQLNCTLVELSLGGCSIRSANAIGLDVLARVDLAERGRHSSARARVAYTRQGMHDQRWVSGLVFIEPPTDFDTIIRQIWMTQQQQQLQRLRGGGEPG